MFTVHPPSPFHLHTFPPSDEIELSPPLGHGDGHAGIPLYSSLALSLVSLLSLFLILFSLLHSPNPRGYRPIKSFPYVLHAYGVPLLLLPSLPRHHIFPLGRYQRTALAPTPAIPGAARCYPRAIRACAIYPSVRRAVPSPHPLPASFSVRQRRRVRRPQSRRQERSNCLCVPY